MENNDNTLNQETEEQETKSNNPFSEDCVPQEEVEEIIEYIRLPESLVGRGTFFALIAKGESMIDAGINSGDYVVVNKEKQHKVGDIVVALFENKSNLKALDYDRASGRYYLRSCNQDKKRFPDIYPDNLQIQGIAVCVIHKLH